MMTAMIAVRLTLLALVFQAAAHAAPRASIEATIRGTDQPLGIELLVRAGESDWRTVAHRALDGAARRVRFDALEAGVYQLRIEGPQSSEQLATKIVLGSKDQRRVVVSVQPLELTGRVTYGGTAIGGVLFLHHNEYHWRAAVAVGSDGTFRAPLWQRGQYTYEIRAPGLSTPFHDVADLTGTGSLVFDVPDARIRGVVRQANGGAPVAGASVVLESKSMTRTATDAEGRFELTGIKDGRYLVRVVSPSHLDPEPVAVQIDAANRERELTFDLDRGRTVSVDVVDAQGAPVVDAIVFVAAGARVYSRTRTDGEGRTRAAAPADGDATLFIVPRTDSFAVHRVAKSDRGPLRVPLSSQSSSLHIRARTSTGAEMPAFSLLLRYNGALVPPEIADALASRQGLILAKGPETDVRLERIPAGRYELWPYRTSEEAEAILSIADDLSAPIQIDVRTGENRVAVEFAAR